MVHQVELELLPHQAAQSAVIESIACAQAGVDQGQLSGHKVLRRSIDARRGQIKVRLRVELYVNEPVPQVNYQKEYPDISSAEPLYIVGSGPAGLFAALKAMELGRRPIVLEMGKAVRDRRRDIAVLSRDGIVDPKSNYCFGEGGAGTFSDGKLYTRSKKRGSTLEVLQTFVAFGAPEDILVDAHPHIGTNKLPKMISAMRECIEEHGGEVRFGSELTDLVIENSQIKALELASGEELPCKQLILATGHSARNIYRMLQDKGLALEAKDIAVGVRVEHPQTVIDSIQYRCKIRDPFLPPASYYISVNAKERSIHSFCMCPGGIIAPCSTEQEAVVTNGWSPSKRNDPFANSGIVVQVPVASLKEKDALAMMRFQQDLEHKAWQAGGKDQFAPAQRLMDLLGGKASGELPKCSYHPGVRAADLSDVLPAPELSALREGLREIGRKMQGYLTNEAIAVAVESRTSAPIRIPRDRETFQHAEFKGLYPCGEGAGYAGGIMTAAVDGIRCAEAACQSR